MRREKLSLHEITSECIVDKAVYVGFGGVLYRLGGCVAHLDSHVMLREEAVSKQPFLKLKLHMATSSLSSRFPH